MNTIGTYERHRVLLGVAHIALAASMLLTAVIVFTVIGGGGSLSGDRLATEITSKVGAGISALLMLVALPGFVAGVAILQRREWAKYLAALVALLNLAGIPVGTLVGAFTLWIVWRDSQEGASEAV